MSMLCRAFCASAITALRSRSSAVTAWASLSAAEKIFTFWSDSTLFTRSRASTVRLSTVPPPSSRSDSVLRWLRITGTLPSAVTSCSSGLEGVPALIWT